MHGLQELGAVVCASTPERVRVRACMAGTEEDTVFWTWAERPGAKLGNCEWLFGADATGKRYLSHLPAPRAPLSGHWHVVKTL